MADITKGLNESNTIWLKAGDAVSEYGVIAEKVEYTWESVGGKTEESIDGALSENWHSERLLIEVTIVLPRANDYPNMGVDFLLNTFLDDKDKQYKESGWGAYIDVVLDMKSVKIVNWKSNRNRTRLTLKFKKKTVGLTT